ncbi:MAG: ABC transporter permease subunit [Anaerolineales bacterium]|nr:ABC transporter permease subunit [Anaerolineales bacterium]
MAAVSPSLPRPTTLQRGVWLGLIGLGLLTAAVLWPAEARAFPASWNLGLRAPIDAAQDWIIVNRAQDHPLFFYFFEPLSAALDTGLRLVEGALLTTPWPVLVAAAAALGVRAGGWRLGGVAALGLLGIGALGVWEPALQTLALMLVAAALSITLGLPLGILAALSDRVDRALRPVLDAMQTLPTFVYLVPVLLLFGVARVPAVVATLIYALPPMVRLTSLGLRTVSPAAVEAGRAFGATRGQVLWKIQLPLALPTLMTGVNQTIMMAMGMVVIAALVGAGGLGREVLLALQRLRVGQAFEAGLAIVILAVVLDRLSDAFSRQSPGAATTLAPALCRDGRLQFAAVVLGLAALWAGAGAAGIGGIPTTWRLPVREVVDPAVRWLRDNVFAFEVAGLTLGTGPFSDFSTIWLLNPVRDFLSIWLPWPVLITAVAVFGYALDGWRLAAASAVSLLLVGLLGMWAPAMDTLGQVLATLVLTTGFAIPLGVLASQFDRFRDALRPLLDFLQTVPSFVLLVPVIMLFNVGRIPGIIAAVLYAMPPGIRLTDLGIRAVAPEATEAARAFGATRVQSLAKVQLPMALPAILAGINQMVMMVLAMVIIAGLVGGAGLGLEVVTGVSRTQAGRAVEAGLAIVLLAMTLDRVTQRLAKGEDRGPKSAG